MYFAPVEPLCSFCARVLEDDVELATGLCTSDDCPRHDDPEEADGVDPVTGLGPCDRPGCPCVGCVADREGRN